MPRSSRLRDEEEPDAAPILGAVPESSGSLLRSLPAELLVALRRPLLWVALGSFFVNISYTQPPWFSLFLIVCNVTPAEPYLVVCVSFLFAYLLLPFFVVLVICNGTSFLVACGSTGEYVRHGFAPECSPQCGFGCYLAGLESLAFAALLSCVTWRLENRVRPHLGCCPSFLRSPLAPITPRQLLDAFWRHCRYAALGKALTWFAVFPLAMLIEPTYRQIYAEAGWYHLLFDADVTNSDPWTIGLTPFDVLTFLALGLVGPIALIQPLTTVPSADNDHASKVLPSVTMVELSHA